MILTNRITYIKVQNYLIWNFYELDLIEWESIIRVVVCRDGNWSGGIMSYLKLMNGNWFGRYLIRVGIDSGGDWSEWELIGWDLIWVGIDLVGIDRVGFNSGGIWSGWNWFRWELIGWDLIRVGFDRVGIDSGGNWFGLELCGWELIGWNLIQVGIDRVGIESGGNWSG